MTAIDYRFMTEMKAMKKSILCVDDNEDSRELLIYFFEDKGFDVTACETLEECLAEARKKTFSAVIMDNHFVRTTSLEACREIRAFNPTTPIIFYNGEARQSEIDKALEAGADKYLIKPFGLSELVETVERLIEQTQTAV
jgi:DNA-binding response OmpR family regulator